MLSLLCKNENDFSHYHFVQWSDNFTIVFDEAELPPIFENTVTVARDIEC